MGFCPFSEIHKLYPRKEKHVNPMIDLVADLGEGFGAYTIGDDSELLEIVSSANIACGFHAGDPDIMAATVAECVRRGVGIGAHPSFPDLRGFGRRDMGLSAHEVQNDVLYQLGALSGFAALTEPKSPTSHHTAVWGTSWLSVPTMHRPWQRLQPKWTRN